MLVTNEAVTIRDELDSVLMEVAKKFGFPKNFRVYIPNYIGDVPMFAYADSNSGDLFVYKLRRFETGFALYTVQSVISGTGKLYTWDEFCGSGAV